MDNQTLPNELLSGVPEQPPVKAIEDVNGDNKKLDPVEEAAYLINQAHKGFNRLTHAVASRKKNALGRVLQAVLFEPLEPVNLYGKAEQELFALCQEVMKAKGVIMNDAIEKFKNKEGVTNSPSQKGE